VHLQNIIEKDRHLAKHQAAKVDYKAYEQLSAENSSALCNTTEQTLDALWYIIEALETMSRDANETSETMSQ